LTTILKEIQNLKSKNLLLLCIAGFFISFLAGCAVLEEKSEMAPTSEADNPLSVMPAEETQANLDIVYPLQSSLMVGGGSFQVSFVLSDQEPLTGVKNLVEVWSPAGVLYQTTSCDDLGKGRYLSGPITLPLRDAAGTWLVVVEAYPVDGSPVRSELRFESQMSYSENLMEHYGFWIDTGYPFAFDTTASADPSHKFHVFRDGGVVIMANTPKYSARFSYTVFMDIYWQAAVLPQDEQEAIDYARYLGGPHLMSLAIPDEIYQAEPVQFQEQSAWVVTAKWDDSPENDNPPPGGYVNWLTFNCPDSEWLWTVQIASMDAIFMPELQNLQNSFICPDSDEVPNAWLSGSEG
jgi:hypothetical protein